MPMGPMSNTNRSNMMRAVRSRDTKPELAFRRAIWGRGLRFRLCDKHLPGKPDVVFPAHRLAVFIDGDFWHGHQWFSRRLRCLDDQFKATVDGDYWRQKIRRNAARDFVTTAALIDAGWRVLRFWESDIANNIE